MARPTRRKPTRRPICSSTSRSSTTGVAATPRWATARQFSSSRTGSASMLLSNPWRHKCGPLEDEIRWAPQGLDLCQRKAGQMDSSSVQDEVQVPEPNPAELSAPSCGPGPPRFLAGRRNQVSRRLYRRSKVQDRDAIRSVPPHRFHRVPSRTDRRNHVAQSSSVLRGTARDGAARHQRQDGRGTCRESSASAWQCGLTQT